MGLTVNGMRWAVGRRGVLSLDGLNVVVEVLDAKAAYGSVRLLVSPVAGSGLSWVESFRVTFYGDVLTAPVALRAALVADID